MSTAPRPPVRSSIACEFCRKSKIKCANKGDDLPCDRCTKLGNECVYKPKGYQQVKRSLRSPNNQLIAPANVGKVHLGSTTSSSHSLVNKSINQHHHIAPSGRKYYYNNFFLTSIKLPPKFLLLKVIKIFFSNQYNGIFQFLHKETYLKHYEESKIDHEYLLNINLQKNPEFDPILLLAILSICARFEPSMVEIYGDFDEDHDPHEYQPKFNLLQSEASTANKTPYNTSNYFGYYARNLVKDVFDKPSVQRVQALSILSSHEWGNSNAARSYLYNGIAARMAIILGLSNPSSLCYRKIENNDSLSQFEKNIRLEGTRRTLWSVYMMDRANASGRNRSFAVKIDEIRIPLPCYDFEYSSGMKTSYPNYDESLEILGSDTKEKKISTLGFQIFFFELWSKIAKWCGEVGALKENLSPMDKHSNFNKLINDLSILESSLPPNLQFSSENLNYYIKINNVENYGYLHCLIFLSKTFLYREIFYLKNSNNLITLANWWKYTQSLLQAVRDSSTLIKTLRSINLIVDAPFLAFQIFTNSIICLYFVAFSNEILEKLINKESLLILKQEFKMFGENNIQMLKQNIWTLGQKYHSLIRELNTNNLRNYVLYDDFKNKIHDYGQGEVSEEVYPDQTDEESPNSNIDSSLIQERIRQIASGNISTPQSTTPIDTSSSQTNGTNLNELIQGFGYENWEIFDMGSVLPGWNNVSPYPS